MGKFAIAHTLVSILMACTYFAFRVELCEEEYEAHHHPFPDILAFASSSLTWESFDKDNAPQAFHIEVETRRQLLCSIEPQKRSPFQDNLPYQPVRDKSPPPAPGMNSSLS